MKRDFTDGLPRLYTLYTLGFLAFGGVMALLEHWGVASFWIGIGFVAFTILAYAAIGIVSRTNQVESFYVAGRQVQPVFNGMATAADWMSGAIFVALAGGIYFGGHAYLAFIVGWTGGYVLVNALMAPYLRKFGCYTVPDFIGTRFGGSIARLCAVAILTVVAFLYVTAQVSATGTIAARTFEIPYELGVWVGLIGILFCSLLGGMRAVTWTQVAQFIVLIIAYLVPVIWMSNVQGFGMLPQVSYGEAVQRIAELEASLGFVQDAPVRDGQMQALALAQNAPGSWDSMASWQFVTLALCMMAGTAAMPHILMRYFTTPSVRAARQSVGWSLLFIFLLFATAPALATLAKLQLLDPELPTAIIGQSVESVLALDWIQKWSELGFLKIDDANGDGILQVPEFFMREDIVVLATPEIAGLPYIITGLVAAGGLAAAMSTADGLLLSIANAISHDAYYKIVNPRADTRRRLLIARILLVLFGAAAAFVAMLQLTGILGAVAWAFCFACSGLFFPLVLGIWWKRATRQGAIAGMLAGSVAAAAYLWALQDGMEPWLGLDDLRFGIIGMGVSLVAMVLVSLLTEAPDRETEAMIDETRLPAGRPILDSSH